MQNILRITCLSVVENLFICLILYSVSFYTVSVLGSIYIIYQMFTNLESVFFSKRSGQAVFIDVISGVSVCDPYCLLLSGYL